MLRRLPEEGEVIMSEDTIERMHDELEEANKWKDNFEHDAAKAKAELSTANERIAYLEGLVALQADALKLLHEHTQIYMRSYKSTNVWMAVEQAISASAETDLDEALRRQ